MFESIEIGRLADARDSFVNANDQVLEAAVKEGDAFASERARAGTPCVRWERLLAPDVFYKGVAAAQILT